MKVKERFNGFKLIQMVKVGGDGTPDRCLVLGRHEVVRDAYVVWEQGTEFERNASHFLNEREAMIELESWIDRIKAIENNYLKIGG